MSGECERCGEHTLDCLTCKQIRVTNAEKRMQEIEAIQSILANPLRKSIQIYGKNRTKQAFNRILKSVKKSRFRFLKKL
jgi:hypothetical protein